MGAAPTIIRSAAEARRVLGEDAARTASRHALWRAGRLDYHLSSIQRRGRTLVYEHPARRIVYLTNRRFGKSRTGVVLSNEKALAYPGVRIPYAAPTGRQVADFVEPHLLELAGHAPPDLAPEQIKGEWVFPPLQWYDARGNPVRTKDDGGVELARAKGPGDRQFCSRIVPVGCEDRKKADRLRGPGTIFAVVDEAGFIPVLPYVLRSVIGPMFWEARSKWGAHVRPKMLVPSTPPEEMDHPFVEVVRRAEEQGALLHATVYDCDHLSEQDIAEAIEEAGGEHTIDWRREGLAIIEANPDTTVLPEMTEHADLVIREVPRPEYFLPHVIGDVGFVDMDVIAFGYYDFANDLDVIEDEVVLKRSRSDMLDAKVAAKERELWGDRPVHRRRVDAAPKIRADMSREEWQGDEDGVRSWQAVTAVSRLTERTGRLRAAANATRVRVQRGRLAIHPRCTTIIAHAKHARWNRARSDFARVEDDHGQPDHHYDGAAALLYFERELDRTTNPFPALAPGVSLLTHHIRQDALQRSGDEKIKRLLRPRRRR